MSLRVILMVQLFLDLAVPVLHIAVACTRFDDESNSFTVMFTILLVVITWSLTNGTSWVLLLRHRRGANTTSEGSGLDWTGLTCHLVQLGPLWRFAKALSGSASSQFANLILLHLIPVFLQDLPLSVLDVYLMLTARREFFLLALSASTSIVSASLILSSYREEVIRLTRKAKPSSHETSETSLDGGGGRMVDFPALGLFKQETEKQSDGGINEKAPPGFTEVRDSYIDNPSLKPSGDIPECSGVKLDTKKTPNSSPEEGDVQETKNTARHWTRFVWMTSILVSRVVSLASLTAVKPWMLFSLLAAQWIIALMGLRIQTCRLHHNTQSRGCKDRLRDVATSYAYIFCFLNLKPGHALAMSAFYHTVILTENVGLVAVFLWNFEGERVYMVAVTAVAFSSFFVAIFIIVVFYCLFSNRAYLLLIEKCACCIWWNSERKRKAEAKVARKAARLEAKKVMTQSGTQINAMATHIITTLSLLPTGQTHQGNESPMETVQNLPEAVDAKPHRGRDSTLFESNSLRGEAIAIIGQDESTPKGVSFKVDALSENQSFIMDRKEPEPNAHPGSADASSDEPHFSSSAAQYKQHPDDDKHKTTGLKPVKVTASPIKYRPKSLLTPSAVSFRSQEKGSANPGLTAEVSVEVHEQRPPGQSMASLMNRSAPTQKSALTHGTDSDGNGMLDVDSSAAESHAGKPTETFDEILLDENLDICASWKQ